MEVISKSQVRKLAVAASLLSKPFAQGKQATRQTVQHLGYVQIDTISVIERAHNHVFWSRQPAYDPVFLDELLTVDKHVFEYWAHAVAYLPMEDFRYYRPKMEAFKNLPTGKWHKERYESARPLFKSILKRIREEGPLASKDFNHAKKRSPAGWWEWKPAKAALEYLYLQGDLMVTARNNFQRVYDLTERVLNNALDLRIPSSPELAAFQIERALQAMGIAREVEIHKYLQVCHRGALKKSLITQVEEGNLVKVQVRGLPGEPYFASKDALNALSRLRIPRRVYILSPFDNLVIQRDRVRKLFDFEYTIECYVPAEKRTYGYFVCPVLWGPHLVARIDMKADRKAKILRVNHLHLEPGLKDRKRFDADLKTTLQNFAIFNGCDTVGA